MFGNFLRKSYHLRNNVEEYGTARRAKMTLQYGACALHAG